MAVAGKWGTPGLSRCISVIENDGFSSLLLLMVQKSGDHQLRLVVYPIIYDGFSTIPGGWEWNF